VDKRHRLPPKIIYFAVWLCHRFNLSQREVEDVLAKRGMGKLKSLEQAQPCLGYMRLFTTYSIWAGSWCQLTLTDILDNVLFDLGKGSGDIEG
jgi:hypothetical protein